MEQARRQWLLQPLLLLLLRLLLILTREMA